MSAEPPAPSERVVSIDALRGFDMFMITGGEQLVAIVAAFVTIPAGVAAQIHHVRWEGFSALDLVMPLFLFIVGVAMPFSFGKRMAEGETRNGSTRRSSAAC